MTAATDRDQRTALIREVREAMIAYKDRPVGFAPDTLGPSGSEAHRAAWHAQHQRARTAVNAALAADLSFRQIAVEAMVDGRLLLPLIDDPTHRRDAYRAQIHHLRREIEMVEQVRARDLYARVVDGEEKKAIAAEYGVSRVTLDAWLSRVD